ncbi:MAG: hypothetical protein WD771_08790 [Gemmatimonadaceae bacterium]
MAEIVDLLARSPAGLSRVEIASALAEPGDMALDFALGALRAAGRIATGRRGDWRRSERVFVLPPCASPASRIAA